MTLKTVAAVVFLILATAVITAGTVVLTLRYLEQQRADEPEFREATRPAAPPAPVAESEPIVEPDDSTSRYFAELWVATDYANGDAPPIAVDEYQDTFERLHKHYFNNSAIQVGKAVETIYPAKRYFPSITYLDAMGYLTRTIPAGSVTQEVSVSTGQVDSSTRSSNPEIPQTTTSTSAEGAEVRTIETVESGGDIVHAAEQVYAYLEYEYYRPQYEQEQRVQGEIRASQEAARQKAAAQEAARIEAERARQRQLQQRLERGRRDHERVKRLSPR